ncbi:MAG: adenylate/guanylate cyclase domain-containing protein, partial [Chloroflexi bacterium]|nr:adenylate/guanylate cyclase domain-containing protein [Chloroflexota bacterium]
EAANECMFLQENAEPGEIVISQATFALVSDRIRAQPFQPTKMKSGFKQHETVYRVLLGDVEARA